MNPFVYRRPRRLVAYWRGRDFIVHPYLHGAGYAVDPAVARALHVFSDWTTANQYANVAGVRPTRSLTRQLDRLVAAGLLERTNTPPGDAATVWDEWNEAAGFMHYSTRDRQFEPPRHTGARLKKLAERIPPPPATKEYLGRPRRILPDVPVRASLEHVLARRRTWRRFGRRLPTVEDLAAVLGLTFRVQRWVDLGASGRVMLRSSPSGGARHATEAYVIVRALDGLRSGAYYYAPAEHALVKVSATRVTSHDLTIMLGGQHWFSRASVLVCMSSVFARAAWVYRSARVYKSLLLEAGHFCQTFCLSATARRVAPFCTAAFAASRIEELLNLDATHESVMYVAGFGSRPSGARWAPLPVGERALAD